MKKKLSKSFSPRKITKIAYKKKKEEETKKIPWLIFSLFVISLAIFLIVNYIKDALVLEKRELYASLTIGDRLDFDANKTGMVFGIIPPGLSISRNITIVNNYDIPIKFEFSVEGNISRFLRFEQDVYLDPGISKNISVVAIAEADEGFGFYEGNVIILFKRAA